MSGNDIYTGEKEKKKGDAVSVNSGGQGGGTPIFGNVGSFMEHLQVHRREEMRPGIEMLGRVRAVAGRRPEAGEEFDLALLPL